ncbi:hypothetical protein METBIDRAFT_39900 [Metschnikowia bicuspidata var. bicuspidata NRRL YB-4993]|uniref:VPS9 domain-containing protein n=1 Tax=Metschnikowia bicuspidata var. bicuspidata NRRL YB-4993 TaxID=869754 RepID=A0A1A0HE10_9ASCO|nr:hypothetical protein METBIDRAFT_39900 [Metschnikowia bicuspidata var. bicuspidata NRRL YB-4993]OBA22137.1 hypothetical protein METBIDRAFT_39900 [Metschnikowia bicuspidata var. bicuspidata NRRL YB-4993]
MGNDKAPAHVRIHNPLLDALFNADEKTPFKNTIHELAQAHSDFSILVPPASVLLNCTDLARQRLVELCYTNEEFVRSHIIRTTSASPAPVTPVSKQYLLIYSTMNGKQILLKNKAVFTGKGFRNSLKVAVVSVGHFVSFSPPFPQGCSFSLIYIEASLYGPQPAVDTPPKDLLALKNTPDPKAQHRVGDFAEWLRKHPILAKTMLPSFHALFHHHNRDVELLRTQRKMPLTQIKRLFDRLVQAASQIVQSAVNADTSEGERTYDLLQSLLARGPGLDMNRMIHEYVELNMYKQVWLLLVYQYKDAVPGERIDDLECPRTVLTHALYDDLACLSLNQLDVPVTAPWDLNILHRRVADAINIFATLSGPNVASQRLKIAVIKETVLTLTADATHVFSGPVIDADTLIGLLIMVVVHSKVPNLEAHLFYMRNFGFSLQGPEGNAPHGTDEDWGFMSYILSNIDAVIFHLHGSGDSGHLAEMSLASAKNYRFWYAIQKQDVDTVEAFLDSVEQEFSGKELPKQHVLRSRNINGESCFHLAIRTRNHHIFSMLLNRTEQWILLEDLIFDKNTTTNQNLLMTALEEEVPEIVCELIDVFLASATREEQALYFNSRDANGRSVGHYLSHDLSALDRLGMLIDWEARDSSSHTPLFSFCRCYDHPQYEQLVAKAFRFVMSKTTLGLISYDAHTDRAGNTLLHALARGLPESRLLSEPRVLMNVNQMNHKGVTPVALYVRYNRLANLENIFRDPRLVFDIEEPKYCYNLMDYYSFSASKSLGGQNEEFLKIERCVAEKYFGEYYPRGNSIQIGFVNARYDGASSDWTINTFHCRLNSNGTFVSKYIPLEKIRQFYKLVQLESSMSFLPPEEIFWMNFVRGKTTVPICSKYKSNRMLEHLSMFFALSNYLRADRRKQFLRLFAKCCKDDSALGLDLLNGISIKRESARNAVGDVTLSESNIQEIVYFVEYSIADLSKYRRVLSDLNTLTALAIVRQNDTRNVTDQFFCNISGLGRSHQDGSTEFRRLDGPYLELQKYIGWIEQCTGELIAKCNSVIEKTGRWRETYSKIKEMNSDLHKFEDLVLPHMSQNAPDNSESVDSAPSAMSDSSMSRRNTLSLGEMPLEEDPEDGFFFSFGLIDSKKSRYRKLVLAKSEEVKKLMDLNVDIKIVHEALAAEISQFLEYRSGALKFGIRQFTNRSLVLLRNRHFELSKLLYGTRTYMSPT